MSEPQTETFDAGRVVCPEDAAKVRRAERNRRHYLKRQQLQASGEAFLFTECRECGKPIEDSYTRGFCPGGACRKAFFKKVQVRSWVKIKQQVSEPPTLSLLPVTTPARVAGAPESLPGRRGKISTLPQWEEPVDGAVRLVPSSGYEQKVDHPTPASEESVKGPECVIRIPSMRINLIAAIASGPGVNRREGTRSLFKPAIKKPKPLFSEGVMHGPRRPELFPPSCSLSVVGGAR
jgi:hypothetical protein